MRARIRRLREARGLTHDQLAAGCSTFGRTVSRGTVQRWESGENAPTVANFAALARVLGVSLDVLVYGEEEAVRIAAERAGADTADAGGSHRGMDMQRPTPPATLRERLRCDPLHGLTFQTRPEPGGSPSLSLIKKPPLLDGLPGRRSALFRVH